MKKKLPVKRIRLKLLAWYDRNRRDLPWRRTQDPYAIWVSEIMLQQTQVETVIPYYRRFLERYPTVETLARAEIGDVLKVWENLGYYARARNLHRAARQVVELSRGLIPDQMGELLRLPGIGRYTAGAILSIAFGKDVTAVDGNVRRVISRLCALTDPIDDEPLREEIESAVGALLAKRDPGRFNQALMELGALCCTPTSPDCPVCPLQEDCRARLQGLEGRLPVRKAKKPVPHRQVVAAVVRDGQGRLLLVQRPARGLLGSLWKFPGGILDSGEAPEAGLVRLVQAELAIAVRVGSPVAAVDHAYTHFRITLTAFACSLLAGTPAGPAWRWTNQAELEALPLSRADRRIARLAASAEHQSP
jgi:A/G-specific adenine glycosylase